MNDPQQLLEQYQPEELNVLSADPQVYSARFSPDGRWIVAADFLGAIRRWLVDGEEPTELAPLSGHNGWAQEVAFSLDSKRFFSCDSWGQLRAWDLAERDAFPAWIVSEAHDGWIRDLAVSADGKLLASCGRDRVVRLWNADEGTLAAELRGHEHDIYRLRFHPNGEQLVSGDDRGVVKRWDLQTHEASGEFDASVLHLRHRLQDVGGVRALAFDREGTTLAVGGTIPKNGGTVQGKPAVLLFDTSTSELTTTMELGQPSECFVHDLHLHDDGFVMIVTSGTPGQGKLQFRRPEDDEPFFTSKGMMNCHSLSYHASSRRLAVVATNRGSNGNGRRLDQNGNYVGNNSPIHVLQLPTS